MSGSGSVPREDVLDACLAAAERGDSVAIDRACREHPELVDEIHSIAEAVASLGDHADGATSAVPLDASPPQRIDRFDVLRELGRGGSSIVWLARDPSLDRLVALKVLALTPSRESLERFRREAQALARLRHANVAAVHDVGQTSDGQPWLAMEYVDGTSLAALISRLVGRDPRDLGAADLASGGVEGSASWVTGIVRWLAKVADALQSAHAAGLVHRDVKPANILIDRCGEPYLVDFGLARGADAHTVTRTGVAAGTPLYMAPEQVSQGRGAIGPRSDVYALGVTLYHALTLRAPFSGETTEQVFDQICREDPVAPRRLNPAVSEDLEVVILKAMEKDPAQRYASAAAMREDLESLLALRPIKARPPGQLERTRKWARRNPKAAAAVAMAVVVLAGTWAWRVWQVRQEGYAALAQFRLEQAEVDRAQADLAPQLASLAGFVPPETRGRIAAAQQDVEARRLAAERILVRACDRLEDALADSRWLTPLNAGLRRALCDALVARSRQVSDRGNEIDARAYLDRAQAVSGASWEDWSWGRVRFASTAPESAVYLFRYEPYELGRQGVVPRLVPAPVGRDGKLLPRQLAPGFVCGDPCMVVGSVTPESAAARAGIAEGDLVFRVNDDDLLEPRLGVAAVMPGSPADEAGVRPFDRVLDLNGKPIVGLRDWELSRRPGAEVVVDVSCTFRSHDGTLRTVDGCVPFPDPFVADFFPPHFLPAQTLLARSGIEGFATLESVLGVTVAEAPELLEHARDDVTHVLVWHEGRLLEVEWPAGQVLGAHADWTAYPLARSGSNRFDADGGAARLESGSYLAVFEAPGRATTRRPFVVKATAGGEAVVVGIDPPLSEDVPPGFIYVSGGDFLSQGEPDVTVPVPLQVEHVEPFLISRLEVSLRDWLDFVNDVLPASSAVPDHDSRQFTAEGSPLPRNVQGKGWVARRGDRWVPQSQADGGGPVVGVDGVGVADWYIDWLNQRDRAVGWRYRLPTKLEWELAARGVDGRSYPWGNRFDSSLCDGYFSRSTEVAGLCRPEPRGRFPCDESPYGIRDMAGGAEEENAGTIPGLDWTPWRGGSWVTANPVYFKAASMVPSSSDMPQRGLRLVAERVRG
jgi:formylglycine-generating enzyme required for sulfatase activity